MLNEATETMWVRERLLDRGWEGGRRYLTHLNFVWDDATREWDLWSRISDRGRQLVTAPTVKKSLQILDN
jgi:hypothetical protein